MKYLKRFNEANGDNVDPNFEIGQYLWNDLRNPYSSLEKRQQIVQSIVDSMTPKPEIICEEIIDIFDSGKDEGVECEILAYDKFITGFGNDYVEEVSLEELQRRADVVSLHVPLNRYSNEMINSEFISIMKKPFYLLNLSRGKVIKTSDVIEGLNNGKIKGCGLDVLENEKLDKLTKIQQSEFLYLLHLQAIHSDNF